MRRFVKLFVGVGAVAVAGCAVYVHSHPLIFNESFWGHAHCIKGGGLALETYARDHHGRFAYHTNGYGDALLLMTNEVGNWWASVTGPGYSEEPFLQALRTGSHLSEQACGRVYVQGLSESDNPDIVLLFDKVPTPGGDHCHFLRRLSAPLVREVWTLGGSPSTIPETRWPAFARKQVELLIAAGIPRKDAEKLYANAIP
jgi:hypothetical protein